MAVAAPILAPALAVAGLGMIGAPYWMLNNSKEKWEEATRKLTDLFWAQAESEVFVECIEHWSGLCDDEDEDKDGCASGSVKSDSADDKPVQNGEAGTESPQEEEKKESDQSQGELETEGAATTKD